MKIATIIGARPQFIKAAVLSRELNKTPIEEIIIHTGQHYDGDMSDIFFDEMNIPTPKYMLNINQMNHGAMTGRMIEEIEKKLLIEKPNLVIVYGDTNSTLAGAIASKKMKIKLVHIESGLRSFNMDMPEEINRILTDRISDVLFCPTENAVKNLHREGFNDYNCKIINCGDIMQDAANFYEDISSEKSNILKEINFNNKHYILCTIHRQENTDDGEKLTSIVETLNKLSNFHNILIPLHPRTKHILENENLKFNGRIEVIKPVGYLDMISLIRNSLLVITDSGGLQKEAYFFKKWCLTLRDETEWIELVKNKFNFIVGDNHENIINLVGKLISKDFISNVELYGGGNTARRISHFLQDII